MHFTKARLFRWHAALGVCCGSLLFVVCFGGAMAVLSDEIDWLLRPHLRTEAGTDTDWEAARRSLEMAYPDYRLVSLVAPLHAGFPVRAYARTASGTYVNLYADPATGEALAAESYWNVQRFLRSFHRRFFLPQPFGVIVLTAFALFLGVLVWTGLRALGRKWRDFFRRVRWRAGPKAALADLHRLFGAWSWLLAAVMVLTGIWYGVELVAPASREAAPQLTAERLATYGETIRPMDLNRQTAAAGAAAPGLRIERIYVGGPETPTLAMGYADVGRLLRPRANLVALDPVSGAALGTALSADAGLHEWVSNMADPLHFGSFGGLPTQIVWFLLGLVLSASIPVGMALAFQRMPNKRLPGAGALVASALLSFGLLGYAVYGGFSERAYWTQDPERFVALGEKPRRLGPWEAQLYQGMDTNGPTRDFRIRLRAASRESPHWAYYRELLLEAEDGSHEKEGLSATFQREGGIAARRFPAATWPKDALHALGEASAWTVTAALPDGGRASARFPAVPTERVALAGPPPTVAAVNAFILVFALALFSVLAAVYFSIFRAMRSERRKRA